MQISLYNKILVLNFIYFNSTLAPAASSFFLNSSASFLATPPLISFGAASTKSLASFKPKPVIALTSLITLIFLSPAEAKKTENSDFSSPAGAAAPPAGAAATGAAAVTPHFSSSCLESSAASTTVKVERSSISLFKSACYDPVI